MITSSEENDHHLLRWTQVKKFVHVNKGTDVEKNAAAIRNANRERLDGLVTHLEQFIRKDTAYIENEDGNRTVWEALSSVPREHLDPFQPVTRLSSLFRGQKVPTIDYLLTKLNLLTALVTEMRARPPSSYEATSTAFVTFRDPRQARMVWRELKSQIVVKVRLAPEVKDLDWERLMRTSFTGDIVRGLGVNSFFWLFTILWVVPANLIATGLFSVDSLQSKLIPLQKFFSANPRFKDFVSVTLPTIIVSLLTMAVPEMIFQISKRAQGFFTSSALYDQCLCRYWKFVICNVVIFFCIGSTVVESVVFQIGSPGSRSSLLNAIAYSFPKAAPFYISYFILGMGLHTGFELLGFIVPILQHFGARNANSPRARAIKTLPRNFNRYYWLPFHILIISIVFLFALLNPLVIPFALVYIFVALTVFKKNFAYQYFRRFNEKEGVVYFTRILRFTLDGLIVTQVVILVFFSVTEQAPVYIGMTATLIPITVAAKVLGTKLWKSQCRAVEDDEANAYCGIESQNISSSHHETTKDSLILGTGKPFDARANGRFPISVPPPKDTSFFISWWNRVHDSFNANGNDRPSYFATAHARGSHVNAKSVTQAVANAPVAVVKKTAGKGMDVFHATATSDPMAQSYNMQKSTDSTSVFPSSDDQVPRGRGSSDHLAGSTAKDVKQMFDGELDKETPVRTASDRIIREHGVKHSGDAPYMSAFDTITNHAPINASDDGSASSLGDGEYETLLGERRRQEAEDMRKKRVAKRRSLSHSKPRRSRSAGSDVSESDPEHKPSLMALTEHEALQEVDVAPSHDDKYLPSRIAGLRSHDDQKSDANSMQDTNDEEEEKQILIKPHAPVRWDDTPNNCARYNNPFYSAELDPFLWLPRFPEYAIDLCDTIEWHGPALVSSQGGNGFVGEWDEDKNDEEGEHSSEIHHDSGGEGGDAEVSRDRSFSGQEHIEIHGALAQRLEEADEMDESVDPAASVPRHLLNDYRKALDEEQSITGTEEDGTLAPLGLSNLRSAKRDTLPKRRSSLMSRSTSRKWSRSSSEGRQEMSLAAPDDVDEGHYHTSPMQIRMRTRRESSVAASSIRSAGSETDQAKEARNTSTRSVSMQRALKAEVLEEEYVRTIKDRLKRRQKQTSRASETSLYSDAAHSPEAESAILARHEQKMHRDTSANSMSSRIRHGKHTNSVSPIGHEASWPSMAMTQGTREQQEEVALQDLSTGGDRVSS